MTALGALAEEWLEKFMLPICVLMLCIFLSGFEICYILIQRTAVEKARQEARKDTVAFLS